ncbi:hypothetical protein [Chamaesiphon sp.]|uniref:hypothetical protein n=1 Tax=Chamaesiphon sp. TaxID=2814140 RepID=UPI0035946219
MEVEDRTIAELKTSSWLTKLAANLNRTSNIYAIGCLSSLSVTTGWNYPILAQSIIPSTPDICDVNLTMLNSTDANVDRNIVTADTVSPKGTTIPSLWWTSEQFPAKLVTNWIANRSQNQIYLLVDTQYWNILDYIDRYRTIDRFGRVAQGYGYNLKICNTQKIELAGYTCDNPGNLATKQNLDRVDRKNTCEIWLNTNGQNGLGVNTKRSITDSK